MQREALYEVLPDGRRFVVGRGVVQNVTDRKLVDVRVRYDFVDDSGERLDFVCAWVVNDDEEEILEPGATARYSFRQAVSSWTDEPFHTIIQFLSNDIELRLVNRSEQ